MKRKLKNLLLSFIVLALLVGPKMEIHAATDLTITTVTTSPELIQTNSDFTLKFNLTNTLTVGLENVSVQIDSGVYSQKGSGSVKQVGSIGASGTVPVEISMTYGGDSSNKIPVTITYNKVGVAGTVFTKTDYITVNAVVDNGNSSPSTPTDTTKYQPNLVLSNAELPTIYTGIQNAVSFQLKNNSNYAGTHITIIPNITQIGTTKIRINQVNLEPKDATINAQMVQAFNLVFIVDDGLASGTYPIALEATGTNPFGDSYKQTILTYINVVNDAYKTDYVTVNEQSQSISAPKAGETVALNFTILNDSMSEIKNLEVWIEGLTSTQFGLVNKTSKQELAALDSAVSSKFTFNYVINELTPSSSYPYKLFFQYYNSDGNLIKREVDYNIFVASKAANAGAVEVSNLVYPTNVVQEQPFNVSFNIKNTGDIDLRHIKVAFDENTVFLPTTASVITFDKLAIGGTQLVKFSLIGTGDELKSRNYPLSFTVTYDGPSGSTTPLTTQQTIGVFVDSTSEKDASKSVPKIIIAKYESDPMIINAGSEFDLSLSFMNTHLSKIMKNIKAYLTVTEISKETTGSVFTPVNSSNTFFIDSIAPKATVDRQIRLYTVPDASPKTYTITVNFEYEDEQGNPFTATELVGINVKQPTKVDTSEFQLPTEAYVGQPIYIYFDLYNTGKVKAYNLMIKAEGNFTADPQSYYIGNFDTGIQDYYEGNLIPNEPGQLTGKFIISYDDSTGEHFEIIKDISLNVMEMAPMEAFSGEGGYVDPMMPIEEDGKKISTKLIFAGVATFVVAIIVTTIILLKRRKAKKEGLIFDED